MAVNLDDLGNEIAERKREALKPVVAELLQCFAYEHVSIGEFLDVLATVLYETYQGKHKVWMSCVGHLECAAVEAVAAERLERLDAVLIAPTLDDADRLWRNSLVKNQTVVKVIVEGKTPLKLLSEDGEVTLLADEE